MNQRDEDENAAMMSTALIDAGASVIIREYFGRTALMLAAEYGHVECLSSLIKAGADVNFCEFIGNTVVHKAVEGGHIECLTTLINAGADVNINDDTCQSALHFAAREGHAESLLCLLEAGADVNHSDDNGSTALHESAYRGHHQCIKILVEAGADVNLRDGAGNTGLTHAAWDRDGLTCMKILLAKGAKLNGTVEFHDDCNGHMEYNSLLLFAAGYEGIADFFLKYAYAKEEDRCGYNEFSLRNICRKSIRNHLLKLDLHENLFVRVPRLPLPKAIQSYLLYDQALGDVAEETDESSNEPGSASESIHQGAEASTA